MIFIPKILHPKLHTDINLFHQKYDSIWVEFKTSKNKTERSTLLNISYNQTNLTKQSLSMKLLCQLTSQNPIIQILFSWATTTLTT